LVHALGPNFGPTPISADVTYDRKRQSYGPPSYLVKPHMHRHFDDFVGTAFNYCRAFAVPNDSADNNFGSRRIEHRARQKCDLRTVLSSGGFGKPPLPWQVKRANGPK